MKNPFEKRDNTGVIVAVAAGTLIAGTLAYLYLTEDGSEARNAFEHKVKDEAKNLAAGFISGKTGIEKGKIKKVADHFVK